MGSVGVRCGNAAGTQPRWDWGEAEVKWAVLGDPERCSDIRCPVGTRGEGEWGDEKAVGGGSLGLWQGGDGLVKTGRSA